VSIYKYTDPLYTNSPRTRERGIINIRSTFSFLFLNSDSFVGSIAWEPYYRSWYWSGIQKQNREAWRVARGGELLLEYRGR